MPPRTPLFSFWSGPLTYLERLCLASMLAHGHTIDVFTYDRDLQVPSGVGLKDAREILPEAKIIRHAKSNSISLFSNLFRYEGLRQERGIWVDLDIVLLKGLHGMGPYVFGWEREGVINGAILRLPSDSQCLQQMIAYTRQDTIIAPYWSWRKKLRQRVRALFGRQRTAEKLEWGIFGPRLITHFIKANGLVHLTQAAGVFYPVDHTNAFHLFLPDDPIESTITDCTRAVHLFNYALGEIRNEPPPQGSFIRRMCDRHGIAC